MAYGDNISRQQAIDVAKNSCFIMRGVRSGRSVTEDAVNATKRIIVDGLHALPPAQPQRTGKCMWCERLKERNLRIEYYWIDEEGCTASFSEPHIVATGIAKFCPNCGAKITKGDVE